MDPATTTATFTYSDLAKMVEYNFEKGRENIVDLAEKLFPGANKTFTFFAKFKDNAVIDPNITLDGNNLKIAENIPAGKYDVPLSICQEIDDNTVLKTTSFDAQLEYNYMGPPVVPQPQPQPIPQPIPQPGGGGEDSYFIS